MLSNHKNLLNRRFTLFEQFGLISFVILLSGMLLIGWWVATQIRDAVVNDSASVMALYIDSFIAPQLQPLAKEQDLSFDQHQQLKNLITDTPLGHEILSVKVWDTNYTILFSLQPSLIGEQFPDNDDLVQALQGKTVSHLSSLDKPDNRLEREFADSLIETYIPIRAFGTDTVIAVVEFYQNANPLLQQITNAQRQSWIIVAVATLGMYALLSGIVNRGSRLIEQQQAQLQQSVTNLAALLDENRALHQRLKVAAARASEISEQVFHRIGRDLHDGPAQDIALALLRIDEVCPGQVEPIRHALQSALQEIRTLAAGLQLPELEPLETVEVVRRAVREFQRKTGGTVHFEVPESLSRLSLPKKIAAYRVIIEALNNAYRHAHAKDIRVHVWEDKSMFHLQVKDSGPGFDMSALNNTYNDGHLGLVGLQQRIALLSGTFTIDSTVQSGTSIAVNLPLEEKQDV